MNTFSRLVRSNTPPVEPHGGGESAHLERRDVGVGDVAMYILDLRQVLLWHVHKLRRAHLIG